MAFGERDWNGIRIDDGLKDQWLERLFSIPGIAVYLVGERHGEGAFAFTTYPWPLMSEGADLYRDASDAFHGFADVERVDRPVHPLFLVHWIEASDSSWKEAIKRLEKFASGRPVITPTAEDFERDLLLGASEVFAFRQNSVPKDRYVSNLMHSVTPDSENEAVRFLEALADLNAKSVYSVYLSHIAYWGQKDSPLRRWTFGREAALRGLGLWHINTPPPAVEYNTPTWWSVAPGRFVVCVLKWPEGYGPLASVTIEQYDTATYAKISLNEEGENPFFGCRSVPSSKNSFVYRELVGILENPENLQGGKITCDSMDGGDVTEYVAGLFRPRYRQMIAEEIQHVLATCFAKR